MKKIEKYQVFAMADLLHLGWRVIAGTKGGGYVLLALGDLRLGWCSYTSEVLHYYRA